MPIVVWKRPRYLCAAMSLTARNALERERKLAPFEAITLDNDTALKAALGLSRSFSQPSLDAVDQPTTGPDAIIPVKEGVASEEHVLAVAAKYGAVKCVTALLHAGSTVNLPGTNGVTVRANMPSAMNCVYLCYISMCVAWEPLYPLIWECYRFMDGFRISNLFPFGGSATYLGSIVPHSRCNIGFIGCVAAISIATPVLAVIIPS